MSAPPRVHALLRGAADGPLRVVHRGRDAVYVEVAGRCVGVVGRRASAVPCALRSRSGHLHPPGRGSGPAPAYLRGGILYLDGRPLQVGRIVDVRVPPLPDTAGPTTMQASPPAPVAGSVVDLPPDLPPYLTADHVARLVGLGGGLTPLGDDVLCGWLAVHRAAGVATPAVDAAVRAHLSRTTLLSATLLECALAGEVLPEFAAYVATIGTPHETDRAAALAAVGHTSGAGLLHGSLLALAELDHTNGVAA